jgi:outer membrane scaffolding protein for murein synthesis (MipA/OmpV family)
MLMLNRSIFRAGRATGQALVTAAIISLAATFSAATVQTAAATDVKIGGIGLVTPKYEGSDSYEIIGAPFAYPVFGGASDGSFSVNGIDDVRFRLLNHGGFEAGVIGGYAFGRDQSDGRLLRGLGDIDAGFIAGAFVGYRAGAAFFDVSYHRIVSGDDTGGYFRAGVTHTADLSSQLTLITRVGTTYADDDYNSAYFGVSAVQSANSLAGLNAFDADAGFKDVHVSLTANYDITPRWTLMAGVGYKRLIGDAADSPVVETPDQFSAKFGATYRFSWR